MNSLNLDKKAYVGSPSTLCKGCGHDAITSSIVSSLYELSIDPSQVIKVSGIGCSSKTPNYFSDQSFGFNSIHGRMAPLATGVHLSLPTAKIIGISGDGDTASIGLGGFLHLVRRNVPMLYIIADNGVYGLTKGQFSATSHLGDTSKSKSTQPLPEMDMLFQALSAGCGFVARAFSGDQKQLKSILKLGLFHPGTAVVNVISPCVAYGNHESFSKSYTHTQDINSPLHEIDLLNEGEAVKEDELKYKLTPLEEQKHDSSSFSEAVKVLSSEKQNPNVLHTGLIYKNEDQKVFIDSIEGSKEVKSLENLEDLKLSNENFEKIVSQMSL